jgi:hypothetical protein
MSRSAVRLLAGCTVCLVVLTYDCFISIAITGVALAAGLAIIKGSAGSFYQRYRVTAILLTLFIIMLDLAFLFYPRRQPVYRPQPFTVGIATSSTLTGITINVSKIAADRFNLDISVYARTSGFAHPISATIILRVPASARCTSSCHSDLRSYGFGRLDDITEDMSSFKLVTSKTNPLSLPGPQWEESATFFVKASVFGWDENGLDVEAQLPSVLLFDPDNPAENPRTAIYYNLPNGVYDWAEGPSPYYFPPFQVAWSLYAKDLSSPIPVSGTDSVSASEDSARTLAAGVLLGAGGGAFVGAIQEASHTKRKTKKVANRPVSSPVCRSPIGSSPSLGPGCQTRRVGRLQGQHRSSGTPLTPKWADPDTARR